MKNCFLNTGGVNIGGRGIECIRFVDDTVLLAHDERTLKNMLMGLNDRFEDYGMKINISKTKATVIERNPKKIDIRIKGESIEQVDSFKYLGCNISSNMNCCQEVKQKIAMSKQEEKHFLWTLGERTKEKASEMLCVECSVVWCRDLDATTE